MPDNPTPSNPPNNPPHVPTLADKQIDLSAFQLVDYDQEEIRSLPKPHADFAETHPPGIGRVSRFRGGSQAR